MFSLLVRMLWKFCLFVFKFQWTIFYQLNIFNCVINLLLIRIIIINVLSTNFYFIDLLFTCCLCTSFSVYEHTDTILDNSELIRNFSSPHLSLRNQYQIKKPCNAGRQRHCPTANSMGFGATTTTHYTTFLYLGLMLKMVEKDPRKIARKYLFSSIYFFSHVGLISFSFPETLSFFPFTFDSCM